jgi:hypothetical protein
VKLEDGQWIKLENTQPEAEYRVLREQWQRALSEGPKDQAGNTVGMPIEAAMQKFVAEHNAKPGAKPTPTDGFGDQMPTAASSGRVSVKVQGH